MTVRKRKPTQLHSPRVTQTWRDRIQVAQLLNMLHNNAMGKLRVSATRIRSAEILLKKALPDLTSTELKGELTENVRYIAELPQKAASLEEWLKGNPVQPSALVDGEEETKH